MGERIRRMDAKQVEKILRKYGFQLIAQKGSHRKWRNFERNLQVTVPYHKRWVSRLNVSFFIDLKTTGHDLSTAALLDCRVPEAKQWSKS